MLSTLPSPTMISQDDFCFISYGRPEKHSKITWIFQILPFEVLVCAVLLCNLFWSSLFFLFWTPKPTHAHGIGYYYSMHMLTNLCPSLWPSGIGSRLGRNRLWVRFLAVSDIYPMFIEPTITWVPSGFPGYIWLDTKIVFKKKNLSEIRLLSKRILPNRIIESVP